MKCPARRPPAHRHTKLLGLVCTLALGIHSSLAAETTANPTHQAWQCRASQNHWACSPISSGPSLYQKHLTPTQKTTAMVKALGWINDTSDTDNCSICGGHYIEAAFPDKGPLHSLAASPAEGSYQHAYYQMNGDVLLQGPVIINQPDRTLFVGGHATLYPNLKTGTLEKISAEGDVRLHQPGQLILGSAGSANLFAHHAELQDATYLVRVKPDWHEKGKVKQHYQDFTGYGFGQASRVEQVNQNQFTLYNTTYSTCSPQDPTWVLHAEKIMLDRVSGRGVAYNTLLKIHGIPVFYSPYFNFPLNNNRKTGFLYGSTGFAGNSGFYFTTPFYLNLAPNYDDTITPTFYSRRGVLLNNNLRYLTPWMNGSITTDYTPHDNIYGGARGRFTTIDNAYFGPHWQSNLTYNYVSDDQFVSDFSDNVISANQVLLNREFSVNYSDVHWQFTGLLQGYQIINDELSLDNRPYRRLPELDLAAEYPNLLQPFAFSFTSQFVNFQKSIFQGQTPLNGQRSNLAPGLSLPMVKSYGYITPAVMLNATSYHLINTAENPGYPDSNIQRVIPMFDIDSGLYFDRDFTFADNNYVQTLQPRLFYLNVPYQDQNNIPIFDTSLQTFNYDSLFSTNRFNGIDRIGDADQLSYSVSSSIKTQQGQTLLSAGVGQIIYFETRAITLCQQGAASSQCNQWANSADNTNRFSDDAGYLNYQLTADWGLNTNLTYNPYDKVLDYQSYQLQYKPDPRHIVNIGYQNDQNDYALMSIQQLLDGDTAPIISQLTTSFVWGFTPTWSAIGGWNYAFNAARVIDEFAGLEYNACCWAVRLVTRRYVTDTDPNNPSALDGPSTTATMLQFQLKGLGSTSDSQIESLEQQIPGYDPKQSGFTE